MKRKSQSGVVTLEFATGFLIFWLMIVAWLEVAYVSYVTSINDLAINEAALTAKKNSQDYLTTYGNVLKENDSIWSGFIDPSKVIYTVTYKKGLTELSQSSEKCLPELDENGVYKTFTETCGSSASGSALAVYYMSYEFDGVFSRFFNNRWATAREIIVVQEYERDQFVF
ncbi:hypothetical protein ST37_12295 [Vibrio sp. qd031]|nr:hypothetical protein ST37_12295 [Vibrio sp. qd031]